MTIKARKWGLVGYDGYKHIRGTKILHRIKAFRRITIRYERLASTFLALIKVACIIIYLRILQ